MSILRADSISNRTGTGAPTFPNGVQVTGVVTATSFSGALTGNVTGNINSSGISTLGNTVVGGGTTQLIVTGNARITGILTIGTSSITLDGSNNQVNVGTGVTLHHTNGVQVGGNTLHSTVLTVNNINASGVVTATSFSGSGANLTGLAATANVTTSSLVVIGVSTVAAGSTAAPSITPTGDSNTGIFFPSADTIAFGEGGSETMRVNSSGELLIGTSTRTANGGVLQVSNGITFPATQSACSDANTLDDYEEGTFTPGVSGVTTVSGTPAYDGRYVKIGKMVYAEIRQTAGTITVASGNSFTGLPFTPGTASAAGSFTCIVTAKSGITNAYTDGSLFINQLISTGTSISGFVASISYLIG